MSDRATGAQRRENTAGILERFACAHETLAARGEQPDHQRAMAASARRAAVRVRRPHNPTAER